MAAVVASSSFLRRAVVVAAHHRAARSAMMGRRSSSSSSAMMRRPRPACHVLQSRPLSASSSDRDDDDDDDDDGPSSSSSRSSFSRLINPTPDHLVLRQTVRSFADREVEHQALSYNRSETFNVDLFRRLGSSAGDGGLGGGLGVLGLTVPEEYGGTGMADATSVCIVHEELSYSDPALCLSYLAHSILFANNLAVNGSPEQLATFLPPVCDGTKIGGMCMSEPNAGTDVLGMRTRAVPTSVSGVDGYVINGTKMWITNGTISGDGTGDVYLVYARTGDGRSDITQFVVEGGMPGFRLGSKIGDKLGMRASPTAELVFEDVFVPSRTHVVGDANGAASCMMRNLEIERVALAAMAVGIARRALDEMASYASSRSAFGRPNLFGFGQIQRHVSESYAEYRAGKSYLYAVANGLDLHGGGGNGLDADGVKLYCATMAKNVSDRAIQVLGGNGYVGEYVVERLWRDSKLLEIGGGTNESHHKNMSRDLLRMGGNKLE